jgi:plastocyanin
MQPGRFTVFAGVLYAMCAVPAHAATVTVVIDKLVYAPAEINAKVGDTIEWDNKDILQHTATAKDGSWNVLLPPKKKGSMVVKKAGTFDYYCKFHPNMKGKLTVTP